MGLHFCDPLTNEIMPLPLWYRHIGFAPRRFAVGDAVATPFALGTVARYEQRPGWRNLTMVVQIDGSDEEVFFNATDPDVQPAPRLPADICPHCYDTGVELVRNDDGRTHPYPCLCCDAGEPAQRQQIAAVGHDVLFIPVERQREQFESADVMGAWYWRSLLEEDAAQDRRDKLAFAIQGL